MKSGIVLTAEHELVAKRALRQYAESGKASRAYRYLHLRAVIDSRLGVTSAGVSRDRLELSSSDAGLLCRALEYCVDPTLYHDPREYIVYRDLRYVLFGSARLATTQHVRR